MKKRILIPTDFSKNAWNALMYAVELYKREQVDFYLLNAYGNDRKTFPKEYAEKELEKIRQHLSIKTVYPDHTFHTEAVYSTLINGIKEMVETKDIEMVIMGTKGETDSKHAVYGSNTIDAMEHVRNCPVLAVPENVVFCDPNEIVFPTSYKTHYKRRELKHLYEISRITNAPVRILHVQGKKSLSKQQQSNKDLLEECFEGMEYSFHWMENIGVQEGLIKFVTEHNSQMIAFINKKHPFFGSVFSNPMVKKLGLYSKVPVLALHDLRN